MAVIRNVVVTRDFFDGNLADTFLKLGYPGRWKRGERRDLPSEVVKAVVASGGEISIDAQAKESRIVEGAEPVHIDATEHYKKQYSKAKGMRVVFPDGFKDGSLADVFAALGRPAEIGVGEIVELPSDVLEKITRSGGFYTNDHEAIAQELHRQGKHELKVRQYQERRAAELAEVATIKADKEHNAKVQAQIDELAGEFVTASEAEREALWLKLRELKQTLR